MFVTLFALLLASSSPRRALLRRGRVRYALTETTQVHHIIPHELRYHPVCVDLQMEARMNVMLLPNKLGKNQIHTNRPCHQSGHPNYNLYTKSRLDLMFKETPAELFSERLRELQTDLRRLIRTSDVPW